MSKKHNVADFYIDGKLVEIRVLHSREAFAQKSISNLLDQGFESIGEFCTKPSVPLSALCDEGHSGSGSVFVALSERDNFTVPVGLSLYSQDEITKAHEMGVLVRSDYLHTRLAFELSRLMVEDAKDNGVKALYTTGNSDNEAMHQHAQQLNMSVRLDKAYKRVRYSLQTDKQPWVVEV